MSATTPWNGFTEHKDSVKELKKNELGNKILYRTATLLPKLNWADVGWKVLKRKK